MEQKIHNTFTRMEDEIAKFDTVFAKGGKFEQAVAQSGGDIAWFNDMRSSLDKLAETLMDCHQAAMPNMDEDVNEGRLGFSDIEKFGADAASKIDNECRRRGSADMSPGEADELRYKVAKEMGYLKESKLTEGVLDGDDEDGFMARSQLYFMARDAIQLHGIINDRDNLPNWVSSKITAASEGIDSVRRYMEYNTQVKGNEYSPQGQMEEDITKFEVEKLEDVNAHSELAMRLAQDFGTEEEQELVADIYNKHMRRGHIERDEQLARDEVIRKYYGSVTEEDGSVEEDYELENIQEMADAYAYSKTAAELRKYASQDTEDMDYADFMDIADTLDDLAKANVIQQSEILGDLNARLRVMDTSPREYIYSLMQAHGLMEPVTETKNYEYKDGKVHISRENFRKVHTDYKNSESGKERMVILDPKTQATVSAPVVFTEGVDFEGSADAADPRKIAQAMMKSAKARAKKKAGK